MKIPDQAVLARQRPARRALGGPPAAGRGREPLVQRREPERARGAHRVRAPLRAHDVPGLASTCRTRSTSPMSSAWAASMNGSTWLDRTNYFETVPASWLELALWLESDRMGFLLPAMTQEKLDNQRSVVKNERRWRVDNQPYGDWDERIQAMVYPPGPPVPPLGHREHGGPRRRDAGGRGGSSSAPTTHPTTRCSRSAETSTPAKARRLVERYFGAIPRGPGRRRSRAARRSPRSLERPVRATVESAVALPRVYLAFRIPPYGADEFYAATCSRACSRRGSRLGSTARWCAREARAGRGGFAFPVVTGAAMLVALGHREPGGRGGRGWRRRSGGSWRRRDAEMLRRGGGAGRHRDRVAPDDRAPAGGGAGGPDLDVHHALRRPGAHQHRAGRVPRASRPRTVRRFAREYLRRDAARRPSTYLPLAAREAA